MSLSTLRPKKPTTEYINPNETLTYPVRRLVKRNSPYYNDKLQLSRYPYRELARFHRQLQLRLMELVAGRIYIECLPIAIRTLFIDSLKPDGFVVGTFRSNDEFFAMLIAYIAAVKDKAVEDRLVVMKSVPADTLKEKTWTMEIVPHCRFLYLDAQRMLILHVCVETRYIESFAREMLHYDDSDEGVEGYALGKIRDFLALQLLSMSIPATEYEFLALKSRKTEGVCESPYLDEDIKSTRSCERMFVSRQSTSSTDANGDPWPTLVIEAGPAYYDPASRWYMHYAVDWWFTQSQGTTKCVLLLFFDYAQEETIIEKWMYDADLPFRKRLVQTLILNVCTGVKKDSDQTTEVSGDVLVLELDVLLGREKRQGEMDIVLDKEMLGVCTKGYLREWRNLGPLRSEALNQDKIHPPETTIPSSPPATLTFSPELPDPIQLPEYLPFAMPPALYPENPVLSTDPSQTEKSQTKR